MTRSQSRLARHSIPAAIARMPPSFSLAPLPPSERSQTPRHPDDLTMGKRQNVTSGRDGGVEPSEEPGEGGHKEKPVLEQGQTLSGKAGGGETDRAKKNRAAININGGQLVDPAYREIGDGGKAANAGNLGNERGKGGGELDRGGDGSGEKDKGSRGGGTGGKVEGVMGDEALGDLGGAKGDGVLKGAGMMNVPRGGKQGRQSKL